ncbi:unnamed protein product [Paramecium sonneborni]|uniref:Uncharacterized protein n=1 Tax=Paramecium sonneborni TaxID=65129 RepID=A0A8S1KLQ3_9CILI|nr:unnamed protein product [Paramecium sonneborni]
MDINDLIFTFYEQEIDPKEDYLSLLQSDRNMHQSLFGLHSPEPSIIENISNNGSLFDYNFSNYDNSGTKQSQIGICKTNKKIRKRKSENRGLLSKNEFINILQRIEQCQSIQFVLDQLSLTVKQMKEKLKRKIAMTCNQ